MPRSVRFGLVYALLAASLVGAGLLGYASREPRVGRPVVVAGSCWTHGSDLVVALYAAARCRFGAHRVDRLGFMPYLGARPHETLEEVAVLDPLGRASFWVAQYGLPPRGGVEVRRWAPCPASDIYC
jgi:hypothetical protein